MEQVNETAPWIERARYVAEFTRVAWLGLEQIAHDMQGQVVSFTLEHSSGGGIEAEAVVTAPERDCRFRMPIWPGPAHPPSLAANLFTTAVEERLRALGCNNAAAQLDLAAQRVTDRRRRTRPGEADRHLAGALHSHAMLLARHGRPSEALPLLDEAIDHYVRLAEHDPDRFTADRDAVRVLKADCRTGVDAVGIQADLGRTDS